VNRDDSFVTVIKPTAPTAARGWMYGTIIVFAVLTVGTMIFLTIKLGVPGLPQRPQQQPAVSTLSPTDRQPPATLQEWTEDEKLEKRKWFANNLNGSGGFTVNLEGQHDTTLVVTHFMMNRDTAVKFVNGTLDSMPYERVGFNEIRFQTSTSPRAEKWFYDVHGHRFKG
jgi:hypothetical protein